MTGNKAFAELFGVKAGIGELVFIGERNKTRLRIGWARGDREFLG